MTQSSIADVLERASVRVERGWTQDAPARKSTGARTWGSDPEATCWCAYAAIVLEAPDIEPWRFTSFACEAIGIEQLTAWNDAPRRTQAEVVSKLREAAALARSQGK